MSGIGPARETVRIRLPEKPDVRRTIVSFDEIFGASDRDFFSPYTHGSDEALKKVLFPKLVKVMKDFVVNNDLPGGHQEVYDFVDLTCEDRGLPLSRGIIWQSDSGLAVLSYVFEEHGPNNLEPNLGAGFTESYRASYRLSGKISGRHEKLIGVTTYFRHCEQKAVGEAVKRLEWVPSGEFVKRESRGDSSSLWFIRPGK